MKDTRRMLWTLLLLLCGGAAAWAQFNPSNPPDPYMLYKVVAKATGGNYTSGSGSYTSGSQVRLNTSAASSNYEFLHWTKNGVVYTTDRQFTYTVEAENVEFVAVYKFNPDNPSDPQTINQFRLYLTPQPEGACSFNRTSGAKAEAGTQVWLNPSASQGFVFEGWYQGEELVSSTAGFYYTMPMGNTTLTARFRFVPTNPGDPEGNQENVDMGGLKGDIDGDGELSVTDVVMMVSAVMDSTVIDYLPKYDMDDDGEVSVTDVVMLVSLVMNN